VDNKLGEVGRGSALPHDVIATQGSVAGACSEIGDDVAGRRGFDGFDVQAGPYLVAVVLDQAQRRQVVERECRVRDRHLDPEQPEQRLQGRAATRGAQRGHDLVAGQCGPGDRPEQLPYAVNGVAGLLEEVAYACWSI
jgi:hypothetical protein